MKRTVVKRTVKRFEDPELEIAYLEARVEALEAALERRSEELRRLQERLGPRPFLELSRELRGLPPLPHHAYSLEMWRETSEMSDADVEESLHDLWASLEPPSQREERE